MSRPSGGGTLGGLRSGGGVLGSGGWLSKPGGGGTLGGLGRSGGGALGSGDWISGRPHRGRNPSAKHLWRSARDHATADHSEIQRLIFGEMEIMCLMCFVGYPHESSVLGSALFQRHASVTS